MSDRWYLFAPGNRPERFDKAFAAGADVVIVDLEDSVTPGDKTAARESVRAWLTPAKPVFIRVNAAKTQWFFADLDLVTQPGVRGVALPMAEDDEAIREIHARVNSATKIMPLIETALGLSRAESMLTAPGVERLAFGSIDFQLDTDITDEREGLVSARSQLVIASRAAGRRAPVDGVTTALDDAALLSDDVARARSLGFGGKLCIHPRQIAAINAGFRPQSAEMAWAKKVIEAATRSGGNAVRLDGKLIDIPNIDRARDPCAILPALGQTMNANRFELISHELDPMRRLVPLSGAMVIDFVCGKAQLPRRLLNRRPPLRYQSALRSIHSGSGVWLDTSHHAQQWLRPTPPHASTREIDSAHQARFIRTPL